MMYFRHLSSHRNTSRYRNLFIHSFPTLLTTCQIKVIHTCILGRQLYVVLSISISLFGELCRKYLAVVLALWVLNTLLKYIYSFACFFMHVTKYDIVFDMLKWYITLLPHLSNNRHFT